MTDYLPMIVGTLLVTLGFGFYLGTLVDPSTGTNDAILEKYKTLLSEHSENLKENIQIINDLLRAVKEHGIQLDPEFYRQILMTFDKNDAIFKTIEKTLELAI